MADAMLLKDPIPVKIHSHQFFAESQVIGFEIRYSSNLKKDGIFAVMMDNEGRTTSYDLSFHYLAERKKSSDDTDN